MVMRALLTFKLLFFYSLNESRAFTYAVSSGASSQTTTSLRAAVVPAAACYDELPKDFPRRQDVLVALEAVRKATAMTSELQPESSSGIATVNKLDTSPVTVADFAAQAIVLRHLKDTFKDDSFIAEESSSVLDDDSDLARQVLEASRMNDMDLLKRSIDLGKEYERWDTTTTTTTGRPPRVWCLDPIDGTKGFLRGRKDGGQYAVALALLEDGIPTVGGRGFVPNLPSSSATDVSYQWGDDETVDNNQGTRGCIFVASKGGGCYQLPVVPGSAPTVRLRVTPNDGSTMTPFDARFCLGVEKFSDPLGCCVNMAKVLHGKEGLSEQGEIVKARRMDSQAKYGVLARAGAEYYVRLPKPGYVEWIWDHAAGKVVVEEAGGVMTDTEGNPIDFSLGAKMSESVKGVLASNGGIFHEALLNAYREQEAERLTETK